MYQKTPKPWSSYYRDVAWHELRLVVFNRDGGRCTECGTSISFKGGRSAGGFVCDHIVDHRGDKKLFHDLNNLRALCKTCHDQKSAAINQARSQQRGEAHPAWLPKPICPVTLITGAPGTGKTTYARMNAKPIDIIIDLDECYYIVCGIHGHNADKKYLSAALYERNKQLASLSKKNNGRGFFIVGAPAQAEQRWWINLLGGSNNVTHVNLTTSIDEMMARGVSPRRIALARDHAVRSRQSWAPMVKSHNSPYGASHSNRATLTPIGADGFPVGSAWS